MSQSVIRTSIVPCQTCENPYLYSKQLRQTREAPIDVIFRQGSPSASVSLTSLTFEGLEQLLLARRCMSQSLFGPNVGGDDVWFNQDVSISSISNLEQLKCP
jgi:hypothetical protein